ncbi:phenylalanine--tRNA ligase subunit beta [Desulfobulbus rhabdoformis]|uniref:phenylalanine--tRNA ligase subunit beta n=1 Tax=Desulfobulbus rhabdoformis TaxID=34032 RepID=UPI001964F8A2|nr:phenylalanine--tRNA ligase subunit beta [Desulfobulbus rhabdoformis]MBM9614900.1 phenylalanine--tRNA ligase subunit beta [Desulfobulbus rhabdoformis]
MKFTLSWLNQFVSTQGVTSTQISDRLTMLGLEVDSVEELFADLAFITTARVTEVSKHPDADKLSVCTVDNGEETVQIVCGAPNVHAGMVTALAKPGVKLPDGTKIKKSKMRGVASHGMLCSSRELGIDGDHSGIMELDAALTAGIPLIDALSMRDTVIEVDLTPNRPDCASVRGIAREVASFVGGPLQPLVADITPLTGQNVDYEVVIDDAELCPRYTARKLKNVKIGPAPEWMQQRLSAVGMRPINNIVDITNYVMLESGQPLHAFDFETLRGKKIVVRGPKTGETELVTLDANKRTLDEDMLLICDAERPVALAGVMGGLDTEITEQSTTILLESACFNPVSIRRTARKLGIPSEASYRFERGVDPNLADKALERAVNLMVEYAAAEPESGGLDIYPGQKELITLQLRLERVNRLLGIDLSLNQVAAYLESIEFATKELDAQTLEVQVPSFRIDIEREIDLVEEVARLVGYNEIPTSQPFIRMDYPKRDAMRTLRQETAALMTAQGFFEAINYSFVSEAHLDLCQISEGDERRQLTRLLNPLTEEQAVMRSMLLPGLLENVCRNINFQQPDIRLFEIGKVFTQKQEGELPEERMYLCAVLSGLRYPQAESLHFSEQKGDFFDIKGLAVNLLQTLRIDEGAPGSMFTYAPETLQPYCDPQQALVLSPQKTVIGTLGAVHPKTLKGFDIKQPVYFLEIDLDQLLKIKRAPKQFHPLPKYPTVKRDISLVVPDGVPAGDLLQAIRKQSQKYLESAEIFDVYRGKSIEAGHKSVALGLTYRSATATLDDKTVDKAHQKIVKKLMADFNARYREGSEV